MLTTGEVGREWGEEEGPPGEAADPRIRGEGDSLSVCLPSGEERR